MNSKSDTPGGPAIQSKAREQKLYLVLWNLQSKADSEHFIRR